jgi:acetyl CoA:N6-hydroxylysine acetyl transferase
VPALDGEFQLRPVEPDDLDLLVQWMNDPEVDRFWELAGPAERTATHLAARQAAEHAIPYVGVLAGVPMSYWELYRADLDPLAAYYEAHEHDGGVHLLLGPEPFRGKGLAAPLLREVVDRMFAEDDRMTRIVAEPDVRNERSIRAFERAGFRRTSELRLPDKQAALMVRERHDRAL